MCLPGGIAASQASAPISRLTPPVVGPNHRLGFHAVPLAVFVRALTACCTLQVVGPRVWLDLTVGWLWSRLFDYMHRNMTALGRVICWV